METKTEKTISLKTLGIIVLVVIIIIAAFLIQHKFMRWSAEKEKAVAVEEALAKQNATVIEVTDDITVTAATLREVIAPASELVAYKYFYTDAGVYEKDRKLFKTDFKIPFTTDKTVYTYTGTIRGGVNLNDMDIDVNENQKKIQIILPAPIIISHELDNDSFQVFDVKNSIFTSTNLDEFQEFNESLKEQQEEKLADNRDFWNGIKDNTENIIRDLLNAAGVTEKYSVQFTWLS